MDARGRRKRTVPRAPGMLQVARTNYFGSKADVSSHCPLWVESGHMLHPPLRGPLRIVIASASVQLRKSLLQQSNIFPGRRLKRPEFALVNVRDLSGINGFKELDEPVSLLMPVLRVHYRLPTLR